MLDLSNTLVLAFIIILIGLAALIYYLAKGKTSSQSSNNNSGEAANFTLANHEQEFFTTNDDDYYYRDTPVYEDHENNRDATTLINSNKTKYSITNPTEMAFIGHESNILWSAPELVLKFTYHKTLGVDLNLKNSSGALAYVSTSGDHIQVNQLLRDLKASKSEFDKRVLYLYSIGTRCYLREGLINCKFENLEQYLLDSSLAPQRSSPTSIVLNINGGNSKVKPLVNLSAKNVSKYKFRREG